MKKKFDICVDDDNIDILDFLQSLFKNGNWHKNFEITITAREFSYEEDGDGIKKVYEGEK